MTVYDLYIDNKVQTTYQSWGKAKAAMYRVNGHFKPVVGNFVVARAVVWGESAPRTLNLKLS